MKWNVKCVCVYSRLFVSLKLPAAITDVWIFHQTNTHVPCTTFMFRWRKSWRNCTNNRKLFGEGGAKVFILTVSLFAIENSVWFMFDANISNLFPIKQLLIFGFPLFVQCLQRKDSYLFPIIGNFRSLPQIKMTMPNVAKNAIDKIENLT